MAIRCSRVENPPLRRSSSTAARSFWIKMAKNERCLFERWGNALRSTVSHPEFSLQVSILSSLVCSSGGKNRIEIICLPFKRPYDDAARRRGAVFQPRTLCCCFLSVELDRDRHSNIKMVPPLILFFGRRTQRTTIFADCCQLHWTLFFCVVFLH